MRISKVFDLSLSQWRWFFIAYAKLLIMQLKLRLFDPAWSVQEIKKYQLNHTADKSNNRLSDSRFITVKIAQELHESVRLAARCQFLPTQCLPKSLVLAQMLRARGASVEIRLGVSKSRKDQADAPQLASHAWVELKGVPIGEASSLSSDFTRLSL